MLQGHLAGNEIPVLVGVPLRVEILDDAYPIGRRSLDAIRMDARVESEPPVVAQLAQQHEELTLAAADLDDVLVVRVEALDQPLRQRTALKVEEKPWVSS